MPPNQTCANITIVAATTGAVVRQMQRRL